jgi:hypothetical protein
MWDNGRSRSANVQVCLNRAVADLAWREIFFDAWVWHLISSRSDHCPVLVELRRDAWENRGPRTFRYKIMWEHVETLSEELKKVWCSTADRENLGGMVHVLWNM